MVLHPTSPIWTILFFFILSLSGMGHYCVESFSCSAIQVFSPRVQPGRLFPLFSKYNGDDIRESAQDQNSPVRGLLTSSSRKAKNWVLTAGLISVLSIAPQLGKFPANAVSTAKVSPFNDKLPTIQHNIIMPSSSSSLSLAASMEAITFPDSLDAFRLPSIAKSRMPRIASIMDLAGVLEDPQRQLLKQAIVKARPQADVQILIVHQVQSGFTPKRMGTTLFNQWRLGSAARNNGILILVVLDERRTEIEVGRGLDQVLNAEWCQQTLQENASPAFRQEEYGKGLLATVEAITTKLQDEGDGGLASSSSSLVGSFLDLPLETRVFLLCFIAFWNVYAYNTKYPILANCPSCNADKDTWTYSGEGWIVVEEATDKQAGRNELQGVCANCGYVYTKTTTIRKYDGRTVDANGNTSYYYNESSSSSDSGGSSDGGGAGDSW